MIVERADLSRRFLSQAQQDEMHIVRVKSRQLEGEKRTASRERAAVINVELRRLDDECERIIGAR